MTWPEDKNAPADSVPRVWARRFRRVPENTDWTETLQRVRRQVDQLKGKGYIAAQGIELRDLEAILQTVEWGRH